MPCQKMSDKVEYIVIVEYGVLIEIEWNVDFYMNEFLCNRR